MVFFPARPDDKCNELAGKDVRVHITKDHKVLIGGVELPGWIVAGGLKVEFADAREFNNLIVRFVVGEVTVDDEAADAVEVQGSASSLTHHAGLGQ